MPLVTPPFRTSLLTQNGAPFATDSGDIQTTKDWWLYWQQLTDRSNANSKLAGEGTHADRPDPGSMPDGAIYLEADRGAIYSNEGGTWQYIAGTMYGTLSPDQRPTDLGTHDAGFEFRGTDVARQFLWGQTGWVEVTAVQYGPHAARPDPATIVEGALYVESDRGGVIYQRETPAGTPLWQYLAGTMWGTLSPDQRPTDLGTHDAGFDFRTNAAPPREFIWNQTAWVEVTPVGGAVNLTHTNVVTKVGTSGQIVEGGITDESAANSDSVHITAAGNLGIRTSNAQAALHVLAPAGGLPALRLGDASQPTQDYAVIRDGGSGYLQFTGAQTGASGYRFLVNGGANEVLRLENNASITMPGLPSSNPGAGSRRLWYDPADGNRVKFAP
jgi:hypothetical protein